MKQLHKQKKKNKEFFMEIAISEAQKAGKRGDYAIGAVVVKNNEIIASGGNRVKTKNDSTRHIEMEVIQYAKGITKDRYLEGYELYTTFEPCFMCLGACWWVGIRDIYYGATQEDMRKYHEEYGTENLKYRPSPVPTQELIKKYNLPIKMTQIMRKECLQILKGQH